MFKELELCLKCIFIELLNEYNDVDLVVVFL